MTRPAAFADVPRLVELFHEMHAASKYAGRSALSEKAVNNMLMGMIAQQNQRGPQGTYFHVALQDGVIVGFMVGLLDRIKHVLNKLVAGDAYLYVRPGSSPTHVLKLIDGYIDWARGNPKVLEIKLSWDDTLPRAKEVARIYKRKGFDLVGEIYEMRVDAEVAEAA